MTLHNLDVGIALAVVMLGVSLLITILTQLIASVLSTRGTTLQKSLTVLFQTAYPEGDEKIAKAIAEEVLRHPLISDSTLGAMRRRIPVVRNFALATTVRAEELIGILEVLAPEEDPAHVAAVFVADAAQTAANALAAPAANASAADAATAAATTVSQAARQAVAAAEAEARAQVAARVNRTATAAAEAVARKAEAAVQTAGQAASRTDAAKMVAKAAKGAVKDAAAGAAEAAARAVADAVQNHANTVQNGAGNARDAATQVAAAGRAAVAGAATNATTAAMAHAGAATLAAVNASAQRVADAAQQAIANSAAAAAAGAPNDPAAAARAAGQAVAYASRMAVPTDRHATIRALLDGARKVAPTVEAVAEQAKNILDKVGQVNAGAVSIQIDNLLKGVPAATGAILSPNIKDWFNSTMDRASQQFALKMRLFTVICAVVVAFALHLDAFRFLSQVSNDPELRAGLVNASQAMQQQAAVLTTKARGAGGDTGKQPAARGIFTIYREAMQKTADDKAYKDVTPLASVKGDIDKQHFASREAAVRWLKGQLQGDARTDQIVQTFLLNVDGALAAPEDQLLDHAASIRTVLGDSGFNLIPDPYHSWDIWPSTQRSQGLRPLRIPFVWPVDNLHFWGILFSAGLLSLGAPFWFNALKTLSSLRPIVANKEEKERQQGA